MPTEGGPGTQVLLPSLCVPKHQSDDPWLRRRRVRIGYCHSTLGAKTDERPNECDRSRDKHLLVYAAYIWRDAGHFDLLESCCSDRFTAQRWSISAARHTSPLNW